MAREEPTRGGGRPFVGRAPLLRQAMRALAEGPVVIEGEPGIGKTRLLREVAAQVRDRSPIWITGAEGIADLSFGALVPLIGTLPNEGDAAVLADTVRSLLGDDPRRVLLLVDDAQWLDRRTAGVVRLAAGGGAQVIVAHRVADSVPEDIRALGRDDRAQRLVLQGLDDAALGELSTDVLGDSPDDRSLTRLAELSGGNPLFAKELLAAALRSGDAHPSGEGVHLVLDGVPDSLRTLLSQRIQAVSEQGRPVLELAALAHGVPVRAAIDLHGAEALDAAEQTGLLEVDDTNDRLQVTHPLVAAALVEASGAGRRRTLLGDLLGWALGAGADLWPGCDDRLVARWALDARADVPDELLLRGLRMAVDQRDDALALRIGAEACARGARGEAQVLRARALHLVDRSEEALAHLHQVDLTEADDALLGAQAAVEAEVRFWGLGDVEGARHAIERVQGQIVDPGWAMSLVVSRLTHALLGGEADVVVDGLDGVEAGGALGFTIASVLVPALTLRGDGARADQLSSQVAAEPETSTELAAGERTMAEVAAAFAWTEAGDHDRADAMAHRARDRARRLGAEPLQAWAALMLGRLHLARGDLEAADRWFAEVVATSHEQRQGPGARWGVAGRLLVAAHGEQLDAVATHRRTLETIDPKGRLMMEPEVDLALAHASAATGSDPDPHLAAARARIAATGNIGLAPAVELAAMTLGRPFHAVSVPDDASPLLAARAAALQALDRRAAAEAAAAHEVLATLGALVDAAVVAAASQRLAPSSRSASRAAVARRRSVPAVRLPMLQALDRPELTPREHEIARLTAAGLTTAETARIAGCSVRTVENHLHRCYEKLGISSRHELAAKLESGGAPGAGGERA